MGYPDDPVEDLLAACLDSGDAEAALVSACERHPAHAAALRQRFAALRALGLAGSPVPPPAPSRLGRFELGELLGSGGMGSVHAAIAADGTRCAVKRMLPGVAWLPGRRERFRREAFVLQRLQHPGIVRVLEVGEADGVPFLVMEQVPGRSLAEVLAGLRERDPATLSGDDLQGALGPGTAFSGVAWTVAVVRVAHAVALALAHAHERGVLHRDVKASNVLVTRDGRVVLIDFGLARDVEATTITHSGTNPGSLPYMAPEAVLGEGERFEPRLDVYALGVLLYELLTLRLPFVAADASALRAAILAGDVVPPRSWTDALTRELENVCLQAMAADPRRRYATAAELAEDLANVLAMRPVRARAEPRLRRWWRWWRARPLRAALALALSLSTPVAGVAGAWWWWTADAVAAGEALARQREYEELLTAGFLHLEHGQRARAMATLRQAEALADGDVLATAGRMLASIDAGDPAAALAICPPDAVGALAELRAQALAAAGRGDEAAALRARLGEPDDPAALFVRGRSLLQGNEARRERAVFVRAHELISLACALSPQPRLLFLCERVHAAHHAGDLPSLREAIAVLERRWPESIRAGFWIGLGRELYDPAGAIATYRAVLGRSHGFLDVRRNLAGLLLAQGDVAAAQQLAAETVVLEPGSADAWFELGMARQSAGDLAGAEVAFRRTLALQQDHAPALCNVGLAESRAGNLAEAERLYRRAVALAPELPVPANNLAILLEDRNELVEALHFSRVALAADPERIQTRRQLVRCLLRNGLHDEVRRELAALVERDGKAGFTHELAVWVHDTLGDATARAAEDARWAAVTAGK